MDSAALNEYDDSILQFIKSASPTELHISEEFDSLLTLEQITESLNKLKTKKYIRSEKHINTVVLLVEGEIETDPSKFDNVFVITKIGENYLSNPKQHYTNKTSNEIKKENKWFWWVMGIIGGVIVLIIGAYVFGVGR